MDHSASTGGVEVRGDAAAGVINTGYIEQHTHQTINVIVENMDRLADLLRRAEGRVRPMAAGGLEAAAGDRTLPLPANLLEGWQLLSRAADAPAGLRCRAYAAWLVTSRQQAPPQRVAAREHYIPLAGRIGFGEDVPLTLHFSERRWRGEGPQRRLERIELGDVTEAIGRYPAIVLLGPPGCGKSTVLHRLLLDTARAFLTGQGALLPLLVNLAAYPWEPGQRTTPLEFVSSRWAEQAAGDFVTLACAGRVLLLADGLNEMRRLDKEGDRRQRANGWQHFIETYFADPGNASRAVLASRHEADYDQPLGLPRVAIDPLKDEQVAAFLHAYLQDEAAGALAAIRRLELLEQARTPYQLTVLAALYDPQKGDLPPNRGLLFDRYARLLIDREGRVGHAHWIQADAQLAALGELGFALQTRGESTILPAGDLLKLLPPQVRLPGRSEPVPTPPGDLFDLACRAGLFVRADAAGQAEVYKFSHHLLQEQFAARRMLARWQAGDDLAGLWQTPRTHREMPPAAVGEWDPLPPPPPRGWEQTTILAAGLADPPDPFVRAVLAANPALAGRCLSEGAAAVGGETRAAVQQALLADLGNPALHRRARLQAGRVLGAVGDPRFVPQVANGVEVVWTEWVYVPGGRATIGSGRWDRQAFPNERPRHHVDIAPFYLGRFPVTNAEYDCFIKAGGYETEAYWTPAGWQWRQGQLRDSGPVEDGLEFRRYLLRNPGEIERRLKDGRWMPAAADAWRYLTGLSEEDARQRLLQEWPIQTHERPHYWDDPAYNASNQPVVGVTWYEAMAYCAWLTERVGDATNRRFVVRLPAEAEWEWAAGGPRHTVYPWNGRFDPDRANTLEGRVLGTSPVGAYPHGAAACGALDMAGNVWEWTLSLYRDYPYRPDDGREDPLAEGRRVLRGGSWHDLQRFARVSYRLDALPGSFVNFLGFRVVCSPV